MPEPRLVPETPTSLRTEVLFWACMSLLGAGSASPCWSCAELQRPLWVLSFSSRQPVLFPLRPGSESQLRWEQSLSCLLCPMKGEISPKGVPSVSDQSRKSVDGFS